MFILPDSDSCTDNNYYEIPMKCTKATLGLIPMVIPMQSNHGNQLQNHFIGTDISVKLGAIPICIGIWITIGIGVGSVKTVLHSVIEPNFIGIGVVIWVGQWKQIINSKLKHFALGRTWVLVSDRDCVVTETVNRLNVFKDCSRVTRFSLLPM